MPLITEQRLRARAQQETQVLKKSAPIRLNEALASTRDSFDVFLSHSIKDAELVDGARLELEDKGFSVYVDWVVDPSMSRESVSPETARKLRVRMRQCRSLLYMHTENSPDSKWMPWELGYFDGHNGRVAILPVVRSASSGFKGQDYLGIYPFVDASLVSGQQREALWVNRTSDTYAPMGEWLRDPATLRKRA
ncbi:TIR domain-containing protein [Azospirillum rugosum]|uniref:TIR domain-containing protein n=1 Tax=Azospirillum rugosum TaxID=416170 RepID=UPI00361F5299